MVGTITDPKYEKEALIEIGREIKERFDIPLSPQDVWEGIDRYRRPITERRDEKYVPIRELIVRGTEELLKPYDGSVDEADKKWIKELYISAHERNVRMAENALKGLELMKKTAQHLGVISDADDDYLRRVLKALGIYRIFDSMTSSEEAGVGKPNPRIFEIAKKKAGNSGTYYYIGDSERRDIIGARKAGMKTILISWEEKRSSADYIAEDLYDAALRISERKEYAVE